MKKAHAGVASLSVLALAACVPLKPLMLGPAAGAPPVTCDTDCNKDWDRARFWVVKHSQLKIETANDVLVETYSPADAAPSYGFSVIKDPAGAGRFTIRLSMHCGTPLGCDPSQSDIAAAFNYFVATTEDVLDNIEHGKAIR
ncbi:MAG TPA: hypothetical protein VGM67_03540 [Gemmatimonadaceae bacterium]